MKKNLSLLLILATILSVSVSCNTASSENNKTDLQKNEKTSANSKTTTQINSGEIEWTSTPQITSPDTNPPISMESHLDMELVYASDFSDGIAFVRFFIEDKNANEFYDKTYAIDTKGEVMFDVPFEYADQRYNNGVVIVDNTIYNKTGDVVASPEISGYDGLLSNNTYEYILAYKTEEAFTGDQYYLGVLKNTGEWVVPLTVDHPIIAFFDDSYETAGEIINHLLRFSNTNYDNDYLGNNILRLRKSSYEIYYYNLATNELTSNYEHFEERYYQGEAAGIYKYDSHGNKELIIANQYISSIFDDTILCYDGANTYALYDHNGQLLVDYSEYNIDGILGHYNGYLLCNVLNSTGAHYVCLFDPNGEIVFDPIRIDSYDPELELFNENGFVLSNNQQGADFDCSFYDYSGKATVYDDAILDCNMFGNGLALAEVKCENNERSRCYVDMTGKIIIDLDKIALPDLSE